MLLDIVSCQLKMFDIFIGSVLNYIKITKLPLAAIAIWHMVLLFLLNVLFVHFVSYSLSFVVLFCYIVEPMIWLVEIKENRKKKISK